MSGYSGGGMKAKNWPSTMADQLKSKHNRRSMSIESEPSPTRYINLSYVQSPPCCINMDYARTPSRPAEIAFLFFSAAHSLHISGEDPNKARRYAEKAVRILESIPSKGLQLVTSLHLAAATHSRLGRCEEAVQFLCRSVSVSAASPHDPDLFHASFFSYMQLGDTYFALNRYDSAIECYESGLAVQKRALGCSDSRVAETCVYVAESYLQLLKPEEAEELCKEALSIQDGVSVRRLIGLTHIARGEYEFALENLLLAVSTISSNSSLSTNSARSPLSSSSSSSSSLSSMVECAFLEASIGEAYLALGRLDEAELSYHKALAAFMLVYGETHTLVGSVYVSLADLYLKRGSFNEAKRHCEKALLVYAEGIERRGSNLDQEEIGVGLGQVASLFESMGEVKHAIYLLEKARGMLLGSGGNEGSPALAGLEAQIGLLHLMNKSYEEARVFLGSSVKKHRAMVGGESSLVLAVLLNQRGVACVGADAITEAAQDFQESKSIYESACGAHHGDTLDVCVNLAGAYDAMGRREEAIGVLEIVVEEEENRLGTAHPDVEHAQRWLAELIKESGQLRPRKARTLHDLILLQKKKTGIAASSSGGGGSGGNGDFVSSQHSDTKTKL